MQILEIVLFSNTGKKRTLPLQKGKVNIITGASGTGKSALIEIVEYCLGRRNGNIPEGIIRETVAWFGVKVQFIDGEEAFITRENPSNGITSSNVYLETGDTVNSLEYAPEQPNSNVDALVEYLTRKIGISPNLHTPPEGQTRASLEANIKHSLFFCFQQQDEIASKRILFHRQTDTFIKQSIKDVLPYFLGAIEENRLSLERELDQWKRELKKLKRKLHEFENLRGDTALKATSLLSEAKKVGLVDLTEYPTDPEDIIEKLKQILAWEPDQITLPGVEKLSQYQSDLSLFQIQYNEKTDQINAARSFINDANGYQNELEHQRLRLESIHLFNHDHDQTKCPLCLSELANEIPTINQIKNSLSKVKSNLEVTTRERPRLTEYIQKLETEKEQIYEKIKQLNQIIDGEYKERKAAAELRDLNVRRGRVVGRISLWLESVTMGDDINQIKSEIRIIESKITELETQLNIEEREDKFRSILNRIGYKMTEWAMELNLEHSGDPVRLDHKDLSVVVDKIDRPIPLHRMGSGENWVGYHLIAHLAIHDYFVKHERPVPRFLFLDQPTQVYYPMENDSVLQGSFENLKDEDREAVKRMFKLIMNVVNNLSPNFQIIVTDHADLADDDFQRAVQERWRGGVALIPEDWK